MPKLLISQDSIFRKVLLLDKSVVEQVLTHRACSGDDCNVYY